jgi:RNA polymerase sigma factor (sigma-70 family)
LRDEPSTVYVIDDDEGLRNALALTLRQAGLQVKACASAEVFLAACNPRCRGCAVIDIGMPGMDGLSLQEEMATRGIDVPVLFLTGRGDVESAVLAVKRGAIDFLEKPVDPELLLARIRGALERDRRQARESATLADLRERIGELTPRERQTVRLVAEGYTNKEIARQMDISYRTVEKYRAGALAKLNVRRLVELNEIARLLGEEQRP